MKSEKQENPISKQFNRRPEEISDLPVSDEQAEETRGGELSGHGTHVSGTIGSGPWGMA
jgi:hypothetical protein